MLFAVDTANYSVASLILFGIVAALYMLMGRRDAIFDALPVLVALAAVVIAAHMPLRSGPWWSPRVRMRR